MRRNVAIVVLTLITACASVPPAAQPVRAADDEEANITATMIAAYNVISGPAGRRDWNRFKDLFVPGGRMIMKNGDAVVVMTPDEFIERVKPNVDKEGFFERPVANRIERYGDIAHVFSTYESRHAANEPAPFARGINSFQFARVGDQWKIVTIFWQAEDAAHPIPPQFLAH